MSKGKWLKANPQRLARNSRCLDLWAQGYPSPAIGEALHMDPRLVIVVVGTARRAGDPRAVVRGRGGDRRSPTGLPPIQRVG